MIVKYVVPVLAIAGVAFTVALVARDGQSSAVSPPAIASASAPFPSYAAGAGLIEASTENIAIGTPVSGIVSAIFVKWGDWVNPDDPLFKIDDTDLQGQLLIATAKIGEAEATLAKTQNLLKVGEGLSSGKSISVLEIANRRFDVGVNQAAVVSAKALVEQLKIEIGRRTIRALLPGRILQIKIRLGEYAQSGVAATPYMVLGDDKRLHVRVDLDENDAWRIQPNAQAVAFVRGNPAFKTSIRFERIEPYIIPKATLTGQGTERPDMRVLQVIYSFDHDALPVYIGQLVDVFIEAPPVASGTAAVVK